MRELAGLTPRELRERDGIGLHEAKRRIEVAQILEKLDRATHLEEIRSALVEYIELAERVYEG